MSVELDERLIVLVVNVAKSEDDTVQPLPRGALRQRMARWLLTPHSPSSSKPVSLRAAGVVDSLFHHLHFLNPH